MGNKINNQISIPPEVSAFKLEKRTHIAAMIVSVHEACLEYGLSVLFWLGVIPSVARCELKRGNRFIEAK